MFALRMGKPVTGPQEFDVVVVGGGPAGLTAALYSARYGLRTVVITKDVGGYMSEAPLVDDYPGLPEIAGSSLAKRFADHVAKYGVPIEIGEVVNVERDGAYWVVETGDGRTWRGKAVIMAVGSKKRKLGVPGEDEFSGRGVSYCATCDGPLFRGKVVAVVGGGNSALTSALYLAKLCSRVYLIHRRNEFRALDVYVKEARNAGNIVMLLNTVVKEIIGDEKVRGIKVANVVTGEETVLEVDGVFVEIGLEPPREFFERIGLEVDESGHANVNVDMSTNLPGIFVAGDAAGGPHKYRFEQILTAAAEGAIAADSAFKYILKNFGSR